jgi:beta-lactamase regulating signal transducer with metallopeptidase domain
VIAALLNHLWQSTLFAAGIALLTLALRNNAARIRYGLWFIASLKFLVPFALFAAIGGAFAPAMPPLTMPHLQFMQQTAQPFAATAILAALPVPSGPDPLALLFGVWFCGFSAVLLVWVVRWSRIRAVLREAVPLPVAAPIAVKGTNSSLGPGLFGIFQPVLLLPQGIAAHLTQREMRAILDHELCHLERNDNLTAAIHMIVEALFWFHPLVWWLGARLIAERECACDENVVETGNEAATYAEGILKVCRFYTSPPPPLAAGVLGADLKGRLESIMARRVVAELNGAQKALMTMVALVAVTLPLLGGWTRATEAQIARATAPVAGDDATQAMLRRYIAEIKLGLVSDDAMAAKSFAIYGAPYNLDLSVNALENHNRIGLWRETTNSQAGCKTTFLALLAGLEKSYGKFSPVYPQRKKNDQDQLPISMEWKNGPGASGYALATVYMNTETAYAWNARKIIGGRSVDAAAVWSAEHDSDNAPCLTELEFKS